MWSNSQDIENKEAQKVSLIDYVTIKEASKILNISQKNCVCFVLGKKLAVHVSHMVHGLFRKTC